MSLYNKALKLATTTGYYKFALRDRYHVMTQPDLKNKYFGKIIKPGRYCCEHIKWKLKLNKLDELKSSEAAKKAFKNLLKEYSSVQN